MKLSKIVLTLALAVSTLIPFQNKAHAGLILFFTPAAPVSGALLIAGGAMTLYGGLAEQGNSRPSGKFERFVTEGGMSGLGLGIMLLNSELDSLPKYLKNKFPTVPSYIIDESIYVLKLKSDEMDYDQNGIKAVHLTNNEFSDITQYLSSDVNQEEMAAFEKLMTSENLVNIH